MSPIHEPVVKFGWYGLYTIFPLLESPASGRASSTDTDILFITDSSVTGSGLDLKKN
jgi:hypothetical protein